MRGRTGPLEVDTMEFFLLEGTGVYLRVDPLSVEAMESVLEWRVWCAEVTLSPSERTVGCEASERSPVSCAPASMVSVR